MDDLIAARLRDWRAEPTNENAQALAAAFSRSSHSPTPNVRKVLYSPGFGAGWSSWNWEHGKLMAEYAPIIAALEAGETVGEDHPAVRQMLRDIEAIDSEAVPYLGGIRDLTVAEVTGPYRINEYDGSESIQRLEGTDWW